MNTIKKYMLASMFTFTIISLSSIKANLLDIPGDVLHGTGNIVSDVADDVVYPAGRRVTRTNRQDEIDRLRRKADRLEWEQRDARYED